MDVNREFNNITKHLDDLEGPSLAISLADVSKTLEAVNEAGYHLAAYITKVISLGQGSLVAFPYDLVNILPELLQLSETTADILHPEICEACSEDDECDDEEELGG